jgi:diguanylate cyclase (GGDEF)-like protein/PAS domain S-box-containing protein
MPGAPTIRILLTEDVVADAELEVRELRRAGLRFTHRVVDREDSFELALREFSPDVILSDFSMPGFDGMAALAMARELTPDTPFVFVSGTIGEEYAIRALKNGATDYVLKNNLVRLPAAVERALADSRARREKRRAEAELEIARERLTSIFASLPDMLWSVDAQTGKIIYVSPAAQALFGHSPDEFLADDDLWLEVVHPEDREKMRAAWKAVEGGAPFEIEYRALRRDGGVRWINDRGRLIRGADGATERIDGLARDITEQVESRARIERLSRIRDLRGQLNAAMLRTREREALFREFCRIASERGGFPLARIVQVDAAGKARIAATTESDVALFQAMVEDYNRDPVRARSLFAQALRTGQAVVSNDVAHDERVRNRAALTEEGNYALALLPLLVEGRVEGIISLRAREPGFFDHEEMRLLAEMAGNIAFALELIDKEERLKYLAYYDALTGLPNHALFHERLTVAVDAARSAGGMLALMVLDLERFKAINDTLGRETGDRVLQAVGRRLQLAVGDLDRVARLGANAFAVMFPDVAPAEEAARRLENDPAQFFGLPFEIDGRELRLSVKAGVAVYPADGADAHALFRNAEASLNQAKETGERCLFYTPQINAQVAEQLELERRLRTAVEQGELFLHFQPKYELATRRIVGLEALMRWQAPDGSGLVSPAKFIPVLEQTGLILEAGRQAIARASAMYADWSGRGLKPPRIAVNVSALQMRRRTFAEDVRAALGAHAGAGGGIDLEITESLLMSEVDQSIAKLRELRELGVHVALDDFGTGYSSLAYLSRLPLDALKIDRSFVHRMTGKADATSIVSTIILLAQSLRLKVVAEGVETEEQAELLRQLRCDQAQGFLFSRPVPAARIEELLKTL